MMAGCAEFAKTDSCGLIVHTHGQWPLWETVVSTVQSYVSSSTLLIYVIKPYK